MKREEGFTLIELAVAMVLVGILMTLGALALRTYWQRRALLGSANEVVTQVRQLQERVVAETHPLVYGARFRVGSTSWGLIRYDPEANGGAGSCQQFDTVNLPTGVDVQNVTFATDPILTSFCRTQLSAGSDQILLFYARGNATAGSLTLSHDTLGDTETVTVAGVTGRTERT